MSLAVEPSGIAELLKVHHQPGAALIVGVTGSVAVGKTTFTAALAEALRPSLGVEILSTDGFLWPNAVLQERGLMMRKGYPESFDTAGLSTLLAAARTGAVRAPVYSHMIYDIDPARTHAIAAPDILLVEGLGLAPPPPELDLLIYIDAREADIEAWFVERFVGFWRAAEQDPASFYAQFRSMDETRTAAFARTVWSAINLPNLREHIIQAREAADLILEKAPDHTLRLVENRL
jgi:type I pantothenate kinase